MTSPLVRGPQSLRVRGERARLIWTLAALPLTLAVLGFVLQNSISLHNLLLLLAAAMLYVALARGRFLGGGVRVGERQFPKLHAIVEECAARIGVPVPHVFLREDPQTAVVALGTGEPYALVVSADYVEHFTDDELRFLIGRELGHVAAGHTKLSSLLSANGKENAIVAVAFGAWLRTIEYTADRIGLLCCGSLTVATSAIAVSTFRHVGRKVDLHAFAEQRRELDAEPTLRMGEWLAAMPFSTNRIAELAAFAKDPLYQHWTRECAKPLVEPTVTYAGAPRRIAAFAIDCLIVSALVPNVTRPVLTVAPAGLNASTDPAVPHWVAALGNGIAHGGFVFLGETLTLPALALYTVLLVGFAGQTIGMMILDLRVIGDRCERIGVGRALARYAFFWMSLPLLIGLLRLFASVQPFEKWSRTRLVAGTAAAR